MMMKRSLLAMTMFACLCPAVPGAAGTLTTVASFNGLNGSNPFGNLIADASGTIYGTTYYGGDAGYCFCTSRGTAFSLSSTGTLTTLASFIGVNGTYPQGGLVADLSGTLYGTTASGGASNLGTVFSLTPGGTLTTLLNFSGFAAGAHPGGNLIADASGTLYGTTQSTVFSLTSGGTLTTLASFPIHGEPNGGLVADASGTLYGTTSEGGASALGTVFSVTPDGTFTTLATFDGTNGASPYAGLVVDASGTLYGTTTGNIGSFGTVFSITSGGVLTTLATFNGANGANGYFPAGRLTLDGSGTLYGTTVGGGAYGGGTVFSLTSGGTLKTLANFRGAYGSGPSGGLLLVGSDTLYGTTASDGAFGGGTVFKLTLGGSPPPVGGVPEPASWVLLVAGFGITGASLRRKRVMQMA